VEEKNALSEEKSTTQVQVLHQERLLGRRENLTLVCGFVYHVMNNTCIHLKIKGPNIYMYRRRRIYKKTLEKYNNRKANTYLIVTIHIEVYVHPHEQRWCWDLERMKGRNRTLG
jgi:hypothetical protein